MTEEIKTMCVENLNKQKNIFNKMHSNVDGVSFEYQFTIDYLVLDNLYLAVT